LLTEKAYIAGHMRPFPAETFRKTAGFLRIPRPRNQRGRLFPVFRAGNCTKAGIFRFPGPGFAKMPAFFGFPGRDLQKCRLFSVSQAGNAKKPAFSVSQAGNAKKPAFSVSRAGNAKKPAFSGFFDRHIALKPA
jgi:hypothetical protein